MPQLVDVTTVRAFLTQTDDPAIALQLRLLDEHSTRPPVPLTGSHDGPARSAGVDDLRARLYQRPPIVRIFAGQNADGSWGDQPAGGRRILPTLWLTKILVEMGATAEHPGVARALEYLTTHAVIDGGVSVNGRRDGVLACYTGILADTLLIAGRPDLATDALRWIATFQQVKYGSIDYLAQERPVWGRYLTTKYGGCFAPGTSCLLGVVKGGAAMVRARAHGGLDPAGEKILVAIGRLLADRELFRRRDGGVIPLSAPATATAAARERWLAPAFPLTYQTDLVEVTQLAADLRIPVDRMRPALDRLAAWRLPDGTWPMLRRCSAASWYQPERPAPGVASYWITLRMLRLWHTLLDPTDHPHRVADR